MLTYKAFIFIAMVLLHILEDFHLQGILANMKQKSWWQSECVKLGITYESSKYRRDHVVSLIVHALENSIFITLPLIIDGLIATFTTNPNNSLFIGWAFIIFANTVVHAIIDDFKCNSKGINLIVDQILHFIFIILFFSLYEKYLGLWLCIKN